MSEDGTLALAVNGEIYNHRQLAAELNETHDFAIRSGLTQAVVKRLMSDVPFGILLSGGLDSSLVSAIIARNAERRVEDDSRSPAWWPRIYSFSIGLEGAPDLEAARDAAKHLGTVHHELHFTIQDGLDALADVIHHIETYDVTTVRALTPMYLMARKIKAMGIKMVLSGEDADEVFGGYLYFHKAPDPQEFFAARAHRFPDKTPQTKEGYLYRSIFEEHLPQPAAVDAVVTEPSIACSSAVALEWEKEWSTTADPSGRAISSHARAYGPTR